MSQTIRKSPNLSTGLTFSSVFYLLVYLYSISSYLELHVCMCMAPHATPNQHNRSMRMCVRVFAQMGLDVSMQCVCMLTQSKNISLSPVRQKHWLASTHTPTQTHILSLALSTAACQRANMSNFPVQKGNINLIFLIYLFLICNKDSLSLSNKTFRLMALVCDLSTINAAEQS